MRTLSARHLAPILIAVLCAGTATIARCVPARASGTADLSVTLSGPASVNEGEDAVYSATLANAGPDEATGIVVTDQPPASLTFDASNSSTGCSQSGVTVVCQFQNLPAGYPPLGPLIAFRPAATGSFTNSVTVTANESDPTPDDNTAAAQTTVNPPVSADLSVSLSAPQQVYAGQPVSVPAIVTNGGPDTSSGASFSLTVPAQLSPAYPEGCDTTSTPTTCTVAIGQLQPGQGAGIALQFTATEAGQGSITATVSGQVADPDLSNNSESTMVTVQPLADVALASSATPNPVVAGHKVTETIVLTNNGPSPATGVSWTASWSSDAKGGVAFEDYSITTGSCTVTDASVSCQPGDLANGQQVTLTITLQPRSKGTLIVDSSAASSVYDPTSGDNSTQTAVTIS